MILLIGFILSLLIISQNLGLVPLIAGFLFLILLWLGSKEKTLFNPYYLFSITPFSLMAYNPVVSKFFLMEITFEVGTNIFLGITMFLLGLYLVKPRSYEAASSINRSFWLLFFIGITPHLLGIVLAGLPILAEGQEQVEARRATYQIPILSQLSIFLQFSIICAFKEQKKLNMALSVVISLFLGIASLSKFTILLTLMFIALSIMKYGFRTNLPPLMRVSILVTALSFPLLFGLIHDRRSDLEQSEYQWRQQISTGVSLIETYGDFLYLPYLYATSPWSNLAHNINIQDEFTYGATSAKTFISILQLDSVFPAKEKPIYQHPMNTHAFITDFYRDLGIIGVIVLSFLLGMLVKHIYLKSVMSNDILNDGLWVTFGYATFMMFFSNHFTSVGYPLVTLIIVAIYKLISLSLRNSFKS